MASPAAHKIKRIRATQQQREPWRQEVLVKIQNKDLFWDFVHAHGHSGTSLAAKVGCSRQLISAMARGERTCKPELAHKLAAALDIDIQSKTFNLIFSERRSRVSGRPAAKIPTKVAA